MTIREILDVILAESAQVRATPVFYSGAELGDALNNDYYYVGQLFFQGFDVTCTTPENYTGFLQNGLVVFRACAVAIEGTFSFAGYRIHHPGRRPPVEVIELPYVITIAGVTAFRPGEDQSLPNTLRVDFSYSNGVREFYKAAIYDIEGPLYDLTQTIANGISDGFALGTVVSDPAALGGSKYVYRQMFDV